MRYIKKFERPIIQNTINTPYLFFQEKNYKNYNYNYKINDMIPNNINEIYKTNNNNNIISNNYNINQ